MKQTHRRFLVLFIAGVSIVACNKRNDSTDGTDSADAAAIANDTATEPGIPRATPEGEPARFAFRSGIVEMKYQGDFNGIRRLTFSDYGLQERRLDSAVPGHGMMNVVPPYQLAIMTPSYHGAVDFRSGKGEKMANVAFRKYREAWRTSASPLGEIVLERSQGRRLADTTLMGTYRCRVYEQQGGTFTRTLWVWGGIPIRESMVRNDGQAGNFVLEPTSIRTDVEVPDSLFAFPEGYPIREIPYGAGQ